jgi:hypothetical protein
MRSNTHEIDFWSHMFPGEILKGLPISLQPLDIIGGPAVTRTPGTVIRNHHFMVYILSYPLLLSLTSYR